MTPREIECGNVSSPNQVLQESNLTSISGYEYAGDTRTVDVPLNVFVKKLLTRISGQLVQFGVWI